MNISINILHRVVLLGLSVAFFSGCSSMQSMSSYARTGDTVTIALGGSEENNALVEILKKENISITITDSSSSTYPIKLRHLFRVYPDHSSGYIFNTKAYSGSWDVYVPPLLGQWMATVDLVDPVTLELPPLATGPATISVSSPEQLNPTVFYGYNYAWTNGNLASIAIEVLSGTGVPNNLNYTALVTYDPIAKLEPYPQIIIAPSAFPAANIAGGSFKFIYDPADFSGGLVVVPANHDPNVQLTSNVTDMGNGNKQLDVMLLNTKGFLNHNNRTEPLDPNGVLGIGKMSPLRSVRFNLVFKKTAIANDDINWQNYIQMVSGSYIDLQGYTVVDINPVMSKVR